MIYKKTILKFISIINFYVGFPALTNFKENLSMEERICFEILQSVIHNIYFIQYSHLLHPIKWLVFILTVSNLRLLSSLVIYNLFPLDEPLTFLSCITHHSRLISDQGPTPQILGYKADGCCWSRERQAAYSRSFPKMWEGGVEIHSYYRSLGRWLYNWLTYIITFTFIASTNISIDILMFLTLESMFQLIHTNVWKKTPQEYFVPINSFHILFLLL